MIHRNQQLLRGIIEGCTVAACLTTAEHIGLWHQHDKLWMPVRYGLGAAAIGAGVCVAAQYLTPRELGWAYWPIAAAAALAPVVGRLLRKPDRLDALEHLIREGDSHAVWRSDLRRT